MSQCDVQKRFRIEICFIPIARIIIDYSEHMNIMSITKQDICMPLRNVRANMVSRDKAAGMVPNNVHAINPQKVHQNEHASHNSCRCHQRSTSSWSARAALANTNSSPLSKPSF